jgi:hypothetical protein
MYMRYALLIMLAAGSACIKRGYQPLSLTEGYAEEQRDRNEFVVRYVGNAWTKPELIAEHLMRRCAEITLAHGYDYFRLTHKSPLTHDEMTATIELYRGNKPSDDPQAYLPATLLPKPEVAKASAGDVKPSVKAPTGGTKGAAPSTAKGQTSPGASTKGKAPSATPATGTLKAPDTKKKM